MFTTTIDYDQILNKMGLVRGAKSKIISVEASVTNTMAHKQRHTHGHRSTDNTP